VKAPLIGPVLPSVRYALFFMLLVHLTDIRFSFLLCHPHDPHARLI
jgi:hypothetical protein